jgi:hypothetical protein
MGKFGISESRRGACRLAVSLSEKDLHGVRVQRKRVIGTVQRYPDEPAVRTAMAVFLAELNSGKAG